MSGVDLHLHSNASDGSLSPEELVAKAAGLGLKVISLTDHDTISGIVPALTAAHSFPNLTVIPGIELSTEVSQSEVHVLGYFIDYNDRELLRRLGLMRNARVERAQAMIARLAELGIGIDWSRVCQIADGGSVGRPHLAQAMLEKGYVTKLGEAFTGYLERGAPAYVERKKFSPAAAVELISQSKGLPVLAHPLYINDLEPMIIRLLESGLVGIEVYYKDYTPDEIKRLEEIAARYNLIATGGTDYHGLDAQEEVMMGGVDVPLSAVDRLTALTRTLGD